MTAPRFVQIHNLPTYTGVLLNRDELGLAKRMTYGGAIRTRISSQCLKRHWRDDSGEFSLSSIVPDATRTRELVDNRLMLSIRDACPSLSEDVVAIVVGELNKGLYGDNERQVLLFGEPEINFLINAVVSILEATPDPADDMDYIKGLIQGLLVTDDAIRKGRGPVKKSLQEARQATFDLLDWGSEASANFSLFRQIIAMPAGLVGAMHGRMVTSDLDANIDAAVHVAHAFTVHGEEHEVDYFTAMDDITVGDAAGHINETEINSGTYYSYVCTDVSQLVSNTSSREIAAKAIANLIGLIATVSPGAKKGSTAPYVYTGGMVVELGERQPRSLASAFQVPVGPRAQEAFQHLHDAIQECDNTFGTHESRRSVGYGHQTLREVMDWVQDCIVNEVVA